MVTQELLVTKVTQLLKVTRDSKSNSNTGMDKGITDTPARDVGLKRLW